MKPLTELLAEALSDYAFDGTDAGDAHLAFMATIADNPQAVLDWLVEQGKAEQVASVHRSPDNKGWLSPHPLSTLHMSGCRPVYVLGDTP